MSWTTNHAKLPSINPAAVSNNKIIATTLTDQRPGLFSTDSTGRKQILYNLPSYDELQRRGIPINHRRRREALQVKRNVNENTQTEIQAS